MKGMSNEALLELYSKTLQGLAPMDYHATNKAERIKAEILRRLKAYTLQCERDRRDPLRPNPE